MKKVDNSRAIHPLKKRILDLVSQSGPVRGTFSPSVEGHVEVEVQSGIVETDGTTVFRSETDTGIRSVVALFALFCTVQVFLFFLFVAPFVLPARVTIAILGFSIFLVAIPLYQNNRLAQKLSRFLCKYELAYFPVTLHVEDIKVLDSKETYVFAYEPHSVLPIGIFALAAHAGFLPLPKIKLLIGNSFFFIPFLRHVWTWLGCIPASKKYLCSYLEAGYSCIIVPGGGREVFYLKHDPNYEVAYLKSRKGFVRVAIEMGRPIVPVFCFGQTRVYKWYLGTRKEVNGQDIASFVYWGRFGSFIPFRHPVHVVVGKPIVLKRKAQPSEDEINEAHAQYISALQELIEKYKSRTGYPELQLEIV